MKTLNKKIYLGTELNPVTAMLKNDFSIVDNQVIDYKDGELIYNFDIGLCFDDEEKQRIFEFYEIPYIGSRRLQKNEQAFLMKKLGINHPPTFSTVYNSDSSSMISMICDYSNSHEFVVKPFGGARGIGQSVVNKQDLYGFFEDCHGNMDTTDLREKYNVSNCSEQNCVEENYFRDCAKSNTSMLQEKINIEKEWRVIYFYNETPIIIERKVPETVTEWQSNASVTGEGKQVFIEDMDPYLGNEIIELSTKIASILNTPFLSMDFYLGTDDKLGVLEFQMEMGYRYVNKFQLQHKIVSSVKDMIKDKYEKA